MRARLPLIVFLVALVAYSATLARGVLPADAGEYQVVGTLLGVAHPPGFALYTLASWLVARMPLVAPAAAINWLSALLAAGALALLARAVQRLTGHALAGAAAALALGASTTFWAQATTANIRMPVALATALALERLASYRARLAGAGPDRAASRALAGLALALGLGVAHHGSFIFVAAVLGAYALWLRPAALRRPWPLLAGLLPFLSWLYLPLRAGAFGAPPRIATLDGFLEHVLARGFGGDMFYFANPAALPERLRILVTILRFEFVWPVLALMALGAVAAVWRDRPLGLALLGAWAVHVFVAITYRAPQTVEYLMPAYVLMAAWLGFAAAEIPRLIPGLLRLPLGRWWRANAVSGVRPATLLASALLALALLAQLAATTPSYIALANDHSARDYAEAVLTRAPPGAVVLANWHWATPLWYLQHVEGQRPDVEVRYVYPRGISLTQNWAGEITATLPGRPVVVTSFYPAEYGALPYRFVPLGPAWQVRSEPLTTPPAGLTGGAVFGDWEFLGYELQQAEMSQVALVAAWRLNGAAPQPVSFFVHLLAPDGALHSQMDMRFDADRYVPGEVLMGRYTLPLRPDAPAGTYTLVAGAYRPDDPTAAGRLAEVTLAQLPLGGPAPGRVPAAAGAIPLGRDIWLVRSRVTPAGPVRPGQPVTVDLDFLAARPITSDYTVKVDLIGPDWSWIAQSDSTPAGGAIPTLKWLAGSRIRDRHVLVVPAGAPPGTARLALAIYDAFTQQNLPILDPVLAAQGPTVPLGVVEVAP